MVGTRAILARISSYFTPKTEIPRGVYISTSVLVAVSVFALWCVLSYGGLVRSDFLPTPPAVVLAAYETILDGSLPKHTLASCTVIFSGFILATVLAVPLGILMGSFKIVEAAIEPVTNFARYLASSRRSRSFSWAPSSSRSSWSPTFRPTCPKT